MTGEDRTTPRPDGLDGAEQERLRAEFFGIKEHPMSDPTHPMEHVGTLHMKSDPTGDPFGDRISVVQNAPGTRMVGDGTVVSEHMSDPTRLLREQWFEGVEPGPWHPAHRAGGPIVLDNANGDSLFVDAADAAILVNALEVAALSTTPAPELACHPGCDICKALNEVPHE